jgi:hypothetical protein
MATITGADAKQHATRKLRSRLERGEFAVLFSGAMDGLRRAMLRVCRQIMEPGKVVLMFSRIARASARMVRADAEWRKGRGEQ